MLRRAAPALGWFAAVRLLGVVALVAAAGSTGRTHARLVRWDAQWYRGIAAHGYGFTRVLPDGRHVSDLAFFPLYPALERLVAMVSGLRYVDAGLVVSLAASLVAAVGIFAVGERLHGRRTGTVLVVLWAAVPVGIVESMAYSEALFTALAAWTLWAVLADRWVIAGALCALAGLTRPVGAALVAAVGVAALVELAHGRRRPLVGAVLAPLGLLGYLGWVAVRTGEPRGYFRVAEGWRNGMDGGVAFARWVGRQLTGGQVVLGVLLVAAVVVLVLLVVLLVRDREPLALVLYAAVAVAMTLTTSSYFGSKPRYLLPVFPLLLPVAVRLARWSPRTTAAVLAVLAVASAAYGASWLLGTGPP